MDSSILMKTDQPEVGILKIAIWQIKNSTRPSGLCGENVYTKGLGGPKEITRKTASIYKPMLHEYHRRDGLASAFVSYQDGMSQYFDFNEWPRCVGQRRHDHLT
jgi:hypothetical protein